MSDQSPHADDLTRAERDRRSCGIAIQQSRILRITGGVHVCESKLGPRALEILADIAERLAKGAAQYGGDFDDKPRDWLAEAYEEDLDGFVYRTMAHIERREQKRADAARAKAAERGHRLGEYSDWAKEYGPDTARDGAWAPAVTDRTGVDFVDNG